MNFIKLNDYIKNNYDELYENFDPEKAEELEQKMSEFSDTVNTYIGCLDKFISLNDGEIVCVFGKCNNDIFYNIDSGEDKISENKLHQKILSLYNKDEKNWIAEDEFNYNNLRFEDLPDYGFDLNTNKFITL